jgi:putative transferase (TIGR04331 family)
MLFDRWFMLKQAAGDYDVSDVRVIKQIDTKLVPNDMADFSRMMVGDDWNEMIYAKILQEMSIPINLVEANLNKRQHVDGISNLQPKISSRFKKSLGKLISQLNGVFSRSEDLFLIDSYLGVKNDLLLQIRMGQSPKLWRTVDVPFADYCADFRQWELSIPVNVEINGYINFIDLLCTMIPKQIPIAYLEGYDKLVALTEKLSWPKQPQIVFTSNAYHSDDVFKAWAASKAENGTPLIIGQHGGNYGMALWSFTEEHQIAISDKFLTWGWEMEGNTNVTPIGKFKGLGEQIAGDPDGVALLVQMTLPRYSYHMYSVPVATEQWLSYYEDQCRFVDELPSELRDSLLVRLYAHDHELKQKERWLDRFPDIKLDDGRQSMKELMGKARIFISTYNATTYLESLASNFPTIIFWNTNHWELRGNVNEHFEMLKKVGIFHETPESAAQQMAAVWHDVNRWWQSPDLQIAREAFCKRYAHLPERPLDILIKTLHPIAY